MGVLRWGQTAFTSIINVRVDHWLGVRNIKNHTVSLINSIGSSFHIDNAEQIESFDDAMYRLNISPADLQARKNDFSRLFIGHFLVGIIVVCYALFLFTVGNWGGGLMALVLSLYPITLAFRFHFWLFQIKQKKLGCSLKDWWNS